MSKEEFEKAVSYLFSGSYTVTQGQVIPTTQSITFANVGTEMELAMLFIDIGQSTVIVDSIRRETAAKMYKSFLWGVAKIAKEYSGEVRSFNGDGVLAVFSGPTKATNATKAAMKMVWFMNYILKPKMDKIIAGNQSLQGFLFDFGIGIDVGKVLIVKGGYAGDNNNDLVWVGNPTNYAVKYSKMHKGDNKIHISNSVYKRLMDKAKFYDTGWLKVDMWTLAFISIFEAQQIYTTTYIVEPS